MVSSMDKKITVTLSEAVTAELKEGAAAWPLWESDKHPQDPPGSGKFHFDYSGGWPAHT